MSNNDIKVTQNFHFNIPQIKVIVVGARTTVLHWSRGVGKSKGVLAYKEQENAHVMPRSYGALMGENYRKMMSDLVPNIINGWERLGFVRDVHFIVGRRPSQKWLKRWKCDLPYVCPETSDFFIHWYTGAGMHLMSQDRKVTRNGVDLTFFHLDEGKRLDFARIKSEIIPTLRGNSNEFGNCHQYLEKVYASDKFLGKDDSDWMSDFKVKHDEGLVNLIINEQDKYNRILAENPDDKNLKKLAKQLLKYRSKCVFYSEADSFENAHALPVDYFEEQYNTLSSIEFRSMIMNENIKKIEGGFYAAIDDSLHGYTATNYSHIDSYDYKFNDMKENSQWDSDCIADMPLYIGIDWGGRFNCLCVFQKTDDSFSLIKDFFDFPPKKYADVVAEFCEYYRLHKKKHVHLFYDVAGNKMRDNSNTTAAEDVIKILRANGWSITNYMEGKGYIAHADKYRIWSNVLDESKERDKRFPRFRYNIDNATATYNSMARTRIRIVGNETRKDKSDENKDISQELATHLSDAADTVVCTVVQQQTESKYLV